MELLVVEDDPIIGKALKQGLEEAHFGCQWVKDGRRGLELARTQQFDVIVLDIMLPEMPGIEVLKTLRGEGNRTPVILVTALGSIEERVAGLNAGADDYMVKPFSPTQLVARIRAVMRRVGVSAAPTTLTAAGLTLDRSRGEVVRLHDGASIRLTGLELKLLEAMMLHPGQVLPSDTLITTVWGPEGGDRTMLKQLMYRLRAKIEVDASNPITIETVPGIGYAFNVPAD